MNFAPRSAIWSIAIAAACFQCSLGAQAAEHVVAIQGEVTSVVDELNWFNDSIQVGMQVQGTYNLFDAGYQRSNDPPSSFYRYFIQANGFGFPVLPANLHIALGGHDYDTAPGVFFYGIEIVNDSDGSGFHAAGDGYQVQSPLSFPAHFTDLAFDPVIDPDGLFFPILGMSLRLRDPSGTAWSSTDLPLAAPLLTDFSSAVGSIFIADGNGEPNYAVAEFRITAIQTVPEPSSMAIGAAGLVIAAAVVRNVRVARKV